MAARKGKEYELVPIKPIKDLQSEIKKLQKQLSKKGSPKEFTKILNASTETQKSVKSIVKTTSQVNANISNLLKIFEGAGDEEHENPHPEIITRLEALEAQNKKLTEKLEKVFGELRRLSYFKERLPHGLPVMYKRSR